MIGSVFSSRKSLYCESRTMPTSVHGRRIVSVGNDELGANRLATAANPLAHERFIKYGCSHSMFSCLNDVTARI